MTSRRNLEFQIGSKFQIKLDSLDLESFESQSASHGHEFFCIRLSYIILSKTMRCCTHCLLLTMSLQLSDLHNEEEEAAAAALLTVTLEHILTARDAQIYCHWPHWLYLT